MTGHLAVKHVELVNVQGLENATMIRRVEIKTILARPICLRGRLVTRKNVLFTQNGPIGLHVPPHEEEAAKREHEFVFNPCEQYILTHFLVIARFQSMMM